MSVQIPGPSDALLAELEGIYKDIHAHPELAMQETRTAGIAAGWLTRYGYEVTTGVGKTGVVGVLKNGEGPCVLLRADMDALPIEETTGLDYASRATGLDRYGKESFIAHACGHDMHVAWLMGATRLLAENKDAWRGTVLAVFQPGEETAEGARAMIEDGMVKRFPRPDVTMAQHVSVIPAGVIGWGTGLVMAAADSWEVTLFGRGAHGSRPQNSVDPVVMAASSVMRLQGIVSREIGMTDSAVVTVGALQAGQSENVIPDQALLRLNVRTFKSEIRTRTLAAIKRILEAEAAASGAPKPPAFSVLSEFPPTVNDVEAMERVAAAFEKRFGADQVRQMPPISASEDFSLFGTTWGVPVVHWFVGGVDPAAFKAASAAGKLDELPSNHAPNFAPVVNPTLCAGVEALLAAAQPWLVADAS
ncbi:MAG: amidohydrolase [Xanthobacteraceae bacterium]|jgi:amidohydrolase|nr:amidohydrolase [Xanthobacteraceae bacterium]